MAECGVDILAISASLRKIHTIFWPRETTSKEFLDHSKQKDTGTLVTRRCWRQNSLVLWKEEWCLTSTETIRLIRGGKGSKGKR